MQTARESGADELFISEQHKWSENSAWYQDASRRAGILVFSPDLSVGDFLESDAGFVWVKVAGVRVYCVCTGGTTSWRPYIKNASQRGENSPAQRRMMRKKVPDYLLRMIDDYLSDRWVISEGDKLSLKEEMTYDAPQGSRVGPVVWNVLYDDFLCMDLPAATRIVCFADDASLS